MELFGFGTKTKSIKPSFVPPTDIGGTVNVVSETTRYGVNFDASFSKDTSKLINTYREMASNSDVVAAIDEIVNDAIIANDPKLSPVEIVLDKVELSDNIKKKISDEFTKIISLLKFNEFGEDIFRQWYIDGRVYYHIITNKDNQSSGIEELRMIDPRKIKKIREVIKEKDKNNVDVVKEVKEFYIYDDNTLRSIPSAVKISPKEIICATSGLKSVDDSDIISYLHPALKPFNQLVALEDSLVIYRIARAPERRIFYVDTGNLPPTRADQYMRKIINSHKNKTVYDSVTGTIKDNKHILSMLEDIWLPRKEGNRGTEVSTLPSGQSLGEMDDVLYFMKKLYKAMRIPTSRLDTENSIMQTGVAAEISRDELKFARFINKIRKKFSVLFREALRKQLIKKQIITENDWDDLSSKIHFKFNTNSQIAEMKETEIIGRRLDLLQSADQFAGKYISIETIRKKILNQSEEEYEEEDKRIKKEKTAGLYQSDL